MKVVLDRPPYGYISIDKSNNKYSKITQTLGGFLPEVFDSFREGIDYLINSGQYLVVLLNSDPNYYHPGDIDVLKNFLNLNKNIYLWKIKELIEECIYISPVKETGLSYEKYIHEISLYKQLNYNEKSKTVISKNFIKLNKNNIIFGELNKNKPRFIIIK